MIIAMVVFAVFSYLTSQSASLNELLAYRFFTGLGLGGVTPAFLAMGAELAPKRLRDVFVTVLFASFPGGGLIGSLTSAWVIPDLRLAIGILYRRGGAARHRRHSGDLAAGIHSLPARPQHPPG